MKKNFDEINFKNDTLGLLFSQLKHELFRNIGKACEITLLPDFMNEDTFIIVDTTSGYTRAFGVISKYQDYWDLDSFDLKTYKHEKSLVTT